MRTRSCVSSLRSCRHPEADVSRFLDPAVSGGAFRPRPGGEDRRRRLRRGSAPSRPIWASARSSPSTGRIRAGDDLRNVDWNVFARTDRAYVKRYRGETNSLVTMLLDASNSMKYASHCRHEDRTTRVSWRRPFFIWPLRKQRDAAGLLVFDDEVRNYIRPVGAARAIPATALRVWSSAEPRARTNFVRADASTCRVWCAGAASW